MQDTKIWIKIVSTPRSVKVMRSDYKGGIGSIELHDYRVMYQSIPSLITPRAIPGDSHVLPDRGGRIFAQLSLPGGRGFESEKFSTVLKEKCGNFSICFKETGGSLKIRCSCAVSYHFWQKQ